MPLEHHPLTREFPQQGDTMRKLMQIDPHFPRLAGEYEALDKRIYEIEDGREAADDLTLQGLKLQRVGLKDEIADLLRKAGSA
ncbi:YdcH family protein [Pseudomonas sp. zfem001]|uniref:YdcH family protein n=1 Tax=Pseudomonas sp. zfem001 TaxID=3078196 RepID=UPI00292848CC|nr:YdcH family protein [Pseudomonas sp. zfem001]MDU9406869.1 YdcH family protein [Pseudomonas sp. zfem001]